MRWKKTNAQTIAKIIEEKINTDGSSRDIEQNTGIPHETIAKVLRDDFTQVCTDSQRIADLIDTNDNLQSLADKLIAEKLLNKEETVRISELVTLRESTFKQNQVIKWLSSDKVDWNFTIRWES
jgi:uncharacterized protein YerC